MQKYSEMSKEQLQDVKKELDQQYAEIKAQGLALDMSRGKPSVDQLNISMDMMDVLSSSTDLRCETGVDWKEYEVIDTSCGEKLERWGKYTLVRPDPQVIWDTPKISRGWKNMNAHYHRSKKGGGEWEFFDLPQQ